MLDEAFVLPPAVFLGDLIAVRRRELGYSQREFADLVCAVSGRSTVTRNEVSRYEREARIPGVPWLVPIAETLQLSPELLKQAVVFTRQRRYLRDNSLEPMPHLCPGYLFDPSNDTDQPQPMILIGDGDGVCDCPTPATRGRVTNNG